MNNNIPFSQKKYLILLYMLTISVPAQIDIFKIFKNCSKLSRCLLIFLTWLPNYNSCSYEPVLSSFNILKKKKIAFAV